MVSEHSVVGFEGILSGLHFNSLRLCASISHLICCFNCPLIVARKGVAFYEHLIETRSFYHHPSYHYLRIYCFPIQLQKSAIVVSRMWLCYFHQLLRFYY